MWVCNDCYYDLNSKVVNGKRNNYCQRRVRRTNDFCDCCGKESKYTRSLYELDIAFSFSANRPYHNHKLHAFAALQAKGCEATINDKDRVIIRNGNGKMIFEGHSCDQVPHGVDPVEYLQRWIEDIIGPLKDIEPKYPLEDSGYDVECADKDLCFDLSEVLPKVTPIDIKDVNQAHKDFEDLFTMMKQTGFQPFDENGNPLLKEHYEDDTVMGMLGAITALKSNKRNRF